MATNDVLDRLDAMVQWIKLNGDVSINLSVAGRDPSPYANTYLALYNAAPALIRLARIALRVPPDLLCRVATQDRDAAIKALGEVKL